MYCHMLLESGPRAPCEGLAGKSKRIEPQQSEARLDTIAVSKSNTNKRQYPSNPNTITTHTESPQKLHYAPTQHKVKRKRKTGHLT